MQMRCICKAPKDDTRLPKATILRHLIEINFYEALVGIVKRTKALGPESKIEIFHLLPV